MSIKFALNSFGGIFCIGPRLCRLVQGFSVVSPHAFVIDRSRGPCCGLEFSSCVYFIPLQPMEKHPDFLKKHCRLCGKI